MMEENKCLKTTEEAISQGYGIVDGGATGEHSCSRGSG